MELFIFTSHQGEEIQIGVVVNEREKICEEVYWMHLKLDVEVLKDEV